MTMSDDLMALAAAKDISKKLTAGLNDPTADYVLLSRDDAALALGLVEGLAELIGRQGHQSPEPET